MAAQLLDTKRGGKKVAFEGYLYCWQKPITLNRNRWICVKSRDGNGCKGALISSGSKTSVIDPSRSVDHNHPPNDIAVTVAKTREEMKKKAGACKEKPAVIYGEALRRISDDARGGMISKESIKRNLRKNQSAMFPVVPKNIEDLVIDGNWALTDGETPAKFMFYDNRGLSQSRIVIFASPTSLELLSKSSVWFMDGNFKIAPAGFAQIYCIHVPLGDTAVSTVYAMLQHKTQAVYEEVLQSIVSYCETLGLYLDPDRIMTDFEIGAINAVKTVLGDDVVTKACYYHLTQSTWRKVQELGLAAHYRSDSDFRHFVGMIDGLAFLPIDDVKRGMKCLQQIVSREALELLTYFDENYVNGKFRRINSRDEVRVRFRRLKPLFDPVSWNVHHETLLGMDRTNNHAEAFNNKLASLLGSYNASVWRIIDGFRLLEAETRTSIIQASVGQPPRKRRQKAYINLQSRLQNICSDYSENSLTIESFLRNIGHAIRFDL